MDRFKFLMIGLGLIKGIRGIYWELMLKGPFLRGGIKGGRKVGF